MGVPWILGRGCVLSCVRVCAWFAHVRVWWCGGQCSCNPDLRVDVCCVRACHCLSAWGAVVVGSGAWMGGTATGGHVLRCVRVCAWCAPARAWRWLPVFPGVVVHVCTRARGSWLERAWVRTCVCVSATVWMRGRATLEWRGWQAWACVVLCAYVRLVRACARLVARLPVFLGVSVVGSPPPPSPPPSFPMSSGNALLC